MIGKLVLIGAIGAVLAQSEDAAILNENRSADVSGKYDFGFASEDGIARVETASEDGEVRGQYQYVDDNGETIVVKYTAGKNGFIVDSPSLPKAPRAQPTLPPPPPQPQFQQQQQQQFNAPQQRFQQPQQFQPQQAQQQQFRQQQFQPQQFQQQPFRQQQFRQQQFQPQQFQQQQQQFQQQSFRQQQQFAPQQFQGNQFQNNQLSQGAQRFAPQAVPGGRQAAQYPAGLDPSFCPNYPYCPVLQ